MGNAHPKALRQRAVETHVDDGVPMSQTAQRFKIGYATLRRWVAEYKLDGRFEALPDSGGRHAQKIFEPHERALEKWLAQKPDLTQLELAKMLEQEFELSVCQSTICVTLARLGLTAKKNAR